METKLEIPSITIEEALKEQVIYIDVRTPKEYEQFHLPGAINIPLFTNEERAQVGTIYKQIGKEDAVDIGVKLFGEKIPSIYQKFKTIYEADKDKRFVLYCWRGGMRSKSIVSFLAALQLPVFQLLGGIRAYRQKITKEFEVKETKPFIVLSGNTGTGKTNILHQLEKKGYPIIDLESLANHRGSIFGHIGKEPYNQKQFDEKLAMRLKELENTDYYIIEAESRRIGKVHLPSYLLSGKEDGHRIHLEADLSFRIQTICKTYQLDKNYDQFKEALSLVWKRLPIAILDQLRQYTDQRNIEKIVELLLIYYYDPRYDHSSMKNNPAVTITVNDLEQATIEIEEAVNRIIESKIRCYKHQLLPY
ncbi:tRNA 2-selenouridine(34) synthase MnmH [Anaerobacillus sp. MEB173]|uniref:tRNA 2-selenouridine(34) synthase MnmH n=1 Tax=Anaerobacillus sp. MEB173 TaxID=3383345 RepID=UPI003F92C186